MYNLAELRERTKPIWIQVGLAMVSLILSIALVTWMASVVLRQIEHLASSASENLQWSMAQSDVEYLHLRLALEEAQDGGSLDEVRRWFDVFFARISILETGAIYTSLRDEPGYSEPSRAIRAFLDSNVGVIDSSDSVMDAALPELIEETKKAGGPVRELSLVALGEHAKRSDARRAEVLQILGFFGAVLVFFFLALGILAYTLFHLFRVAQRRASQIEAASSRMKTVVATSPSPIVVTDSDGTIREFNAAAEKLFGYARCEAIERDLLTLLAPDSENDRPVRRLKRCFLQKRRPTPEERQFEMTLRSRNGAKFEAEVSIDQAKADAPLYVCFIRDISGSKLVADTLTNARDQALAAEKAKSQFLAVMSHEMRTPLNGILGSMQLMDDVIETRRQRDLLGRMKSSGQHLLSLVNDVLDLSKFEAGRLEVDLATFSIEELLNSVLTTTAPKAEEFKNETCWRWVGPPGDQVMADQRKIQQILLNFVSNGVKFTRNGRVEIEVEYMEAREDIVFRVSDTGIGIAKEDQARVFEDFETLDTSYARESDGTGLGLGIARRFAKAMRGEIGLSSEAGKGSVFWLRVPVKEVKDLPTSVRPDQPRASLVPTHPLDVLLVEDNEINRRIAREMLESAGHKVTRAANGRIGVERAADHTFDVILMDISMPVMDGTEATRRIREGGGANAATPIIALTAHALPEDRTRFRGLGMNSCLSKPVNRALMLHTMAEVTGQDVVTVGPATQSKPAPQLIDVGVLDAVKADLPERVSCDLLKRFVEDCESAFAKLKDLSPFDPEVKRIVHRCAGSCGTFGLDQLRDRLHRVETAIKRGKSLTLEDLNAIVELWEESRAALAAATAEKEVS